MSVVIVADRRRVWRALTEPTEIVGWDERRLAPVEEPPDDYPFHGQHVRWRYRLGSVQVVVHDRPVEIAPLERLISTWTVGSLRFHQTYSLFDEPTEDDAARTRLSLKVVTSSSVPVMGDVVDRFSVRRLAAEHVDQTLRALQSWCETG